jgi:nicotinamide-nucleotide amidase
MQKPLLTVESLAIGDELLDGRLADGNSRDLADSLAPLGLVLSRVTAVGDDEGTIAEAVLEAAARADVVVTSGGLGPTSDDLTVQGVARAAGCAVRLDEATFARIKERFAERGLPMPDNNRRQAELPETARLLGNDVGIAPGFVTLVGGAEVYSFPGVPREYRWLRDQHLLPALSARLGATLGGVERRTLRCLGITESGLGAALEDLQRQNPDVLVQYRTSFPENHARLVVRGAAASAARADALAEEARRAIGGAVYAIGERGLAELLVAELGRRGQTLALAESCTGGLVGKLVTDVAGASAVFRGALVAYANEVKEAALGVPTALLEEHGAVSELVAAAMAEGARARLGADFAISVTGVAGPGGGTPDKPVGTVCFGLAHERGVETKRRLLLGATREMIRELAAAVALRWLLSRLERQAPAHEGPVAS